MKFKIINRSRFPTRQLRSFVVRSYSIAKEQAGPGRVANFERNWGRITITFARSNRRCNGHSTGHGYYNMPRCHVGVHDVPNRRAVARTIAHEFGHNFGMRHNEMSGGPLYWNLTDEMNARVWGWADDLALAPKPTLPKPGATERREVKLRGLQARLRTWQSKEKRAANACEKLRGQIRRTSKLIVEGDTP